MRASGFEGRPGIGVALSFMLALAPLCGCSGTFSSLKNSIFGGGSAAEKAPEMAEGTQEAQGTAPSVYYVGADALVLYQEPGKSVVARLPLHQKVYRYRLDRGYAYVKVDGSGQEGWLDNAKLIWRLPRVTAPAPSETPNESADTAPPAEVDTAAPPAAADSSAPAAVEAPSSAAAPVKATPSVSPSVFEPF